MKTTEPDACSTRVLSTNLSILQVYVRSNDAVAVFDTVRSAPTHTRTGRLAEPVVPVSFVVNVAVLSWLVHVPAGSPVNVFEYENEKFGSPVSPTQKW